MRKKKLLFLTDYAGSFTGFGKQCKLLLKYLYQTGKYDIVNLAQGMANSPSTVKNSPRDKFPWKTIGTIPVEDSKIKSRMSQDPGFARHVSYGALTVNDVVKEFEPDLIFAINDTWGSQFIIDQPFFNKVPSVCWNTFDSLPLLQDTIDKAAKIKNYWTWSQFATDELHKKGFSHVTTQYPLVNTDAFYKLPVEKIDEIKLKNKLPQDSFIIGFVFRNQLRKLINTQIEAYALFKKNNPEVKNTFLYTHTHYGEGWDIPRLCKQYGVNPSEVLCTYICVETREYFILPFTGQNIKNPRTGLNSLITSNVEIGVTDEQLNEIYNIFSVYSHPATSGACELPCVEAALTEKIVLTCKYSFGEDIITKNKGSFEMPFSFYTEHGTHFLKSQPHADKLGDLFLKIYNLSSNEKNKLEQHSRNWAMENYAINVNGPKIEKFIDSTDFTDFSKIDLTKKDLEANPNAQIDPEPNDIDWLKQLYKRILGREVPETDEGIIHWINKIKQNVPRQDIENYFRKVAAEEVAKNTKISFEELLDKNDSGKRLLVIVPESPVEVFYSTALLKSVKSTYPDYNIYFATKSEYMDIVAGNEYIYKVIPYIEQMEDINWLEKPNKNRDCLFEVALPLHHCMQRAGIHQHNQKDKIQLALT
jgi:glycosyltransferase involved in cell wall biosynthesis